MFYSLIYWKSKNQCHSDCLQNHRCWSDDFFSAMLSTTSTQINAASLWINMKAEGTNWKLKCRLINTWASRIYKRLLMTLERDCKSLLLFVIHLFLAQFHTHIFQTTFIKYWLFWAGVLWLDKSMTRWPASLYLFCVWWFH